MNLSTEKLISLVRRRRPLYDFSCPQYSSKTIKRELWEEVYEQMVPNWSNLNAIQKVVKGEEIQKRWNSLRDCFRRELTLQKLSPESNKRRKYIHFDKLLFLLPNAKGASNLSDDDEPVTPITSKIDEVTVSDHSIKEEPEEPPRKRKKNRGRQNGDRSYSRSDSHERGIQVKYEQVITPPPPTISSREEEEEEFENNKKEHEETPGENQIPKIKENPKERNELKTPPDDDELFVKSLIPFLKKYNDSKKLMLRIEIMSAILKFDEKMAASMDLQNHELAQGLQDSSWISQPEENPVDARRPSSSTEPNFSPSQHSQTH